MNDIDKKRLEEIREEELKLYYEKERILHKEEWEQKKLLYQKIEAIKKAEKVNVDDIAYLLKVANYVDLSYSTKELTYTCRNIAMTRSEDNKRLQFTYVDNSSDFDDYQEDDSNFEYDYIITGDIPFSFVEKENSYNSKPFVNLVLKEDWENNDYIAVTIFLDEEKMEELQ